MKINGKMMVAVAMVAGVLGATGCNAVDAGAQQDGTTADQGDSMAQTAASWFGAHVWSGPRYRPLPPALRVEYPGRAPSPNHVWTPGYWRWDSRQYVWAPGYWAIGYAQYAPPALRVEYPGTAPSARYFWVNGHWSYNGHEYVWIAGHWDVRRDGFTYVQPHWDNVNGRWVHMPGHFVRV